MSVRAEHAREAALLRSQGLLVREIAASMGISRTHVSSLLLDPSGDKDRERKASYGGKCELCGARTDGSNGADKAPRYCKHCRPLVDRKWTRERVIEAIREWARRRGEAPKATEWLGGVTTDPDGYEFPSAASVYANGTGMVRPNFESWADAIEAAGFPRPGASRNYIDKHLWEVENMAGVATITRDYLIFRIEDDGKLALHGEIEARHTSEAIEKSVDVAGRFAAVAKSSLTEYQVAPRLVASAIRNGKSPTAA